ncbi:25264_t:CDS:1, partial [Racocetra persica]
HINNDDGTSKHCKTEFKPKTSTTSIAAYLYTKHQIFKVKKWETQPSTSSTTQLTIDTIFQNQAENTTPLSENQQIRISYRLVVWIVESMMPLDCINDDRFQDFCYEINRRFE